MQWIWIKLKQKRLKKEQQCRKIRKQNMDEQGSADITTPSGLY
jgi:hypothetical protein